MSSGMACLLAARFDSQLVAAHQALGERNA